MHEINWIWRVKIIHFYICSCYFESDFHALDWFDLFFLTLWMTHSGGLVESELIVKVTVGRCESEVQLSSQGNTKSFLVQSRTPYTPHSSKYTVYCMLTQPM